MYAPDAAPRRDGGGQAWKKRLEQAQRDANPAAVEQAANMCVLYESLQLAHKCILNSFYGYVMRRGARWYSMEMAGIVCQTGTEIIKSARDLIKQIGCPLELDTDGIWCMLPASFPEEFDFCSTDPRKRTFTLSYPAAMLNFMIGEKFTNHQYQRWCGPTYRDYQQYSENSVFFEVDGPYKAMLLPASKDEGCLLKKRYAVFNNNGTLAELKGFEVKRRGELKLIKVFQAEVFDVILKGSTLTDCYAQLGAVANRWLDVLQSQGRRIDDATLVDLLSENRTLSRTIKDYGAQKSTSITTALRLAEFLGGQMIENRGLQCRYIISRKPSGALVSERAIPVAIFSASDNVKRQHLRRWLRDPTVSDIDIRSVLDWDYYTQRLVSAIQKIITIPAAMQHVKNPVPRVPHPDWVNRSLCEHRNRAPQQSVRDMLSRRAPGQSVDAADTEGTGCVPDVEDAAGEPARRNARPGVPVVTHYRRTPAPLPAEQRRAEDGRTSGPPPADQAADQGPIPDPQADYSAWLRYMKARWRTQRRQRKLRRADGRPGRDAGVTGPLVLCQLARYPWKVLQVKHFTADPPGLYRAWIVVGAKMQMVVVRVPRVFYANARREIPEHLALGPGVTWRRVNRTLSRMRPSAFLYEVEVSDDAAPGPSALLAAADPDGVFETRVPLDFAVILALGTVCCVRRDRCDQVRALGGSNEVNMRDLEMIASDSAVAAYSALEQELQPVFLHQSRRRGCALYAFIRPHQQRASLLIVDPSGNAGGRLPDPAQLCEELWAQHVSTAGVAARAPAAMPQSLVWDAPDVHATVASADRALQRLLDEYRKMPHRGPSVVVVQSPVPLPDLEKCLPALRHFPLLSMAANEGDNQYPPFGWQARAIERMLRHYMALEQWLCDQYSYARYANVPLCNLTGDIALLMTDVLYARQVRRMKAVLWASPLALPDLGGFEEDDFRLFSDARQWDVVETSAPGYYTSACAEIHLNSLSVCSVLQSEHIREADSIGDAAPTFDVAVLASLEQQMAQGDASAVSAILSTLDQTSLCSGAFGLLKALMVEWLRDVVYRRSMPADTLIVHFSRWLNTPSALVRMHGGAPCGVRRPVTRFAGSCAVDVRAGPTHHRAYVDAEATCAAARGDSVRCGALPLVCGSLCTLAHGARAAWCSRHGALIVYASFSRIIVCTTKADAGNARAYFDGMLQSIVQRKIFSGLHMKTGSIWNALLWMDPFNFAGVLGDAHDRSYLPAGSVVVTPSPTRSRGLRGDTPRRGTRESLAANAAIEGMPTRAAQAARSPSRSAVRDAIEMSWDLCNSLPSQVQELFKVRSGQPHVSLRLPSRSCKCVLGHWHGALARKSLRISSI